MTVSELVEALSIYPGDMVVKVLSDDGNGSCHVDPTIDRRANWILSNYNMGRYSYITIEQSIVEIY